MPFDSFIEEHRHEFWLPADYDYTLKSKVKDPVKFKQFVKDMKMEAFKINEELYVEKISAQSSRSISYEDGFIIYYEQAH